jgi:hypothetical protein
MLARYSVGVSALPDKGLNMKKPIAAIFLVLLAAGFVSGCVVDDGRRGGGGPYGHMDHRDDGDDHEDNRRDKGDDREHH